MMNDLIKSLDKTEMEQLDAFLLDRIPDDADTDGMDEGVFGFSMLDGFLTAIVSSPEALPPSLWMDAMWGDFDPVWESEREMKTVLPMLFRHMNAIAGMLLERPEEFEPIFQEQVVNGRRHLIVDAWCEGYRRGVSVTASDWNKGGREIRKLLEPIVLFSSPELDEALMKLSDAEIERHQQAIFPAVREIYRFWKSRRTGKGISTHAVSVGAVKVGRNEPCPCGSGKKFKRCCGSPLTLVK